MIAPQMNERTTIEIVPTSLTTQPAVLPEFKMEYGMEPSPEALGATPRSEDLMQVTIRPDSDHMIKGVKPEQQPETPVDLLNLHKSTDLFTHKTHDHRSRIYRYPPTLGKSRPCVTCHEPPYLDDEDWNPANHKKTLEKSQWLLWKEEHDKQKLYVADTVGPSVHFLGLRGWPSDIPIEGWDYFKSDSDDGDNENDADHDGDDTVVDQDEDMEDDVSSSSSIQSDAETNSEVVEEECTEDEADIDATLNLRSVAQTYMLSDVSAS